MKKVIKLALGMFMAASLLTGCGHSESAATAPDSALKEDNKPGTADAAAYSNTAMNDSAPSGGAWVLIYEDTKQRPDEVSGMYSDSYSWEKDEVHKLMCHTHVKTADGVPYQKTEFEMTCTLPPAQGSPGSRISFDIAAVLVETNIAKYYFGDSSSVQFGTPGKELGIAGHYFMNILDEGSESATHPNTASAGTGGDKIDNGSDCSVFWLFPDSPQPGDRFSVYFMSFGVETEWCYEYKN